MSPEALAWSRWIDAGTLLARVEERLVNGGAVVELEQFKRLSANEMAVLLRQEATGR